MPAACVPAGFEGEEDDSADWWKGDSDESIKADVSPYEDDPTDFAPHEFEYKENWKWPRQD